MLKEKIQDALNQQIQKEFFSAYLYLSMSAYFESISLPGAANWMKVQMMEEGEHAMKLFNYVNERGGRVILDVLPKPEIEWDSPIEAFKEAYKHECFISESINSLVALAIEEKDFATESMLRWFVDEQVEEESNACENVDRLKMVEGNSSALFMLDKEWQVRQYNPPVDSNK